MYPAEPSVSLRDHAHADTFEYLLTLSLLGLAVSYSLSKVALIPISSA